MCFGGCFAKTKRFLIDKHSLLGCLVLIVGLSSCGVHPVAGPTSANTPEEMFTALIQSPLPQEVTNLEGTGDTWQGHSIYLRFSVPLSFIQSYTADKFETVSCETILSYFDLPDPSYDVFDPSWQPEGIENGICYRSKGLVGEQWLGEQYFLVDPTTNTVYFYGFGT